MLSFCYAQYIFGVEGALGELLAYLKHEDYRIRTNALNLLRDIINPHNETQIKKYVAAFSVAEKNDTDLRDEAEQFLREH